MECSFSLSLSLFTNKACQLDKRFMMEWSITLDIIGYVFNSSFYCCSYNLLPLFNRMITFDRLFLHLSIGHSSRIMWAICIKQDLKQNTCCLSLISIQWRLSPNLQFIRRGDNVPSITNSITVYDDDDYNATWAICCSFRSHTTTTTLCYIKLCCE